MSYISYAQWVHIVAQRVIIEVNLRAIKLFHRVPCIYATA